MLTSVLRANSVSCLLFGGLFLFMAPAVSRFVGDPPIGLVQLLGAVLLANAVMLLVAAHQAKPKRMDVLFFIAGDAAWVIATLVLIASAQWITTTHGVVAAIFVALFVAACGALQWKHLPEP